MEDIVFNQPALLKVDIVPQRIIRLKNNNQD
jgi:hypothetical protein